MTQIAEPRGRELLEGVTDAEPLRMGLVQGLEDVQLHCRADELQWRHGQVQRIQGTTLRASAS
ncbi:hypothetical protein QFZ79_003824 [Arthrobacter sp. V4I6]|uniref:hypothetical protein n=1 Tax=unclassified Arthrobacter TaxID=235627 RepID=UPI0027805613|nr:MULTISPECIES: hypothetical protein [unclassified Arthrobacter]MDQ0821447.1 hypothetical protein [Arthrobacter sp. V1I7]MDQ0855713.1 hypothetical protein [Arthrobacter sp. V4I6]